MLTERWQNEGWRPAFGVWTAAQTAQFLCQVRGHRQYALFHLVALRGLRRGEAAGLRWDDLDLDAGTLTVSGQLQQLGGRMVAASGLPPVTLHGLRHGAATLALAAGTDLKVVQDQLGHSTVVLTADTYTSVLPETARTAAERTAALLFPARGRPAKPAARQARKPPLPAWARPDRRRPRRAA